jgi:hypothetical protein
MNSTVVTATSRFQTARDITLHGDFHSSDQVRSTNAALRTGLEIKVMARTAWDQVSEAATMGPADEVSPIELAARRTANALSQASDKALGLVSNTACGLWVVTWDGQVGIVESTDHGSDYLTMVRWSTCKGAYEYMVENCVAFFEFESEAMEVAEKIQAGDL